MESLKARGCCSAKQLEISGENSEALDMYFSSCGKLDSYDWLREVSGSDIPEVVEVRFKNTRKGFYRNVNELTRPNVQEFLSCSKAQAERYMRVIKLCNVFFKLKWQFIELCYLS